MEKGFNTDIEVNGQRFHVQTEDWGRENPFLVTRIFRDGAVIKSVKTSYHEAVLDLPRVDHHTLRLAMKDQHQSILDWLLARDGRA